MTIKSALRDANNALLDLQQADHNTFERPLKRLAQALNAPELAELNQELKAGVDFDQFVSSSKQGGSFAGSGQLVWPEGRREELGLSLILIERGAADPEWLMNFGHQWFYGGSKIMAGIRKMVASVFVPFLRDYRSYVEDRGAPNLDSDPPGDVKKVFIVHGHDDAARESLARFLESVGLTPVILHEQASKGMTVPEKLIAYSSVGFAVVLLTPDDLGRSKSDVMERERARQNVILELGYFVGRLGRGRVCALRKGDVDIPSDYLGVVYTDLDKAGGWKQSLAQELEAAGYDIDWNNVMRRAG